MSTGGERVQITGPGTLTATDSIVFFEKWPRDKRRHAERLLSIILLVPRSVVVCSMFQPFRVHYVVVVVVSGMYIFN
jgi:hypothetical protein